MLEYYGDSTRWFIATVVNSTPPAGYEGRVKIRIHGLHSSSTQDIPEDHLPWAQCVLPTTEGGVSGIGKIPRVLPSALVFGMFMDGKSSQTPIVLGSLPKIESPSEIQKLTKQSSVEQGAVLASTLDIKNAVLDVPDATIKNNRIEFCLQFFLNLGYSYIQAKGITENLSQKGMVSGFRGEDESGRFGVAEWSGERFKNLKAFSETFKRFTTQLEFIAFELNGTQRSANIRLLQTDRYSGEKGSLNIFAKYYLKLDLLQLEQLESKGDYSE
jgi:hypothetical protein